MPNIALPAFSRRLFLSSSLAALAACRPGDPPAPCPADPSTAGTVTWIPDVGRPVAWGEEHLTEADGAPMPLSIYYPSARFLPPRPMLQRCAWRFPLVLFIHGQSPSPATAANYHRAWWRIPVALARSGHVVLVPHHSPNAATPASAMDPAVDWLFASWHGAPWVNRRIESRAVIGHSYGALIAARYAAAHPGIGAMGSLGGVFTEDTDPTGLLASIPCPAFFMFADGDPFEDLRFPVAGPLISKVPGDRYACIYTGSHFDYLEQSFPGVDERGPCSMVAEVAADLLALFVGSNLHSLTRIAVDLKPPVVQRTPEQEALAIQYLHAQDRVRGRDGCAIKLQWTVSGETGERRIAP